jgi:geranylgeranyl reductase family protein
MRESRDVVVVGAGPAGAACALTLASFGLEPLVLDRARFPRSKACAGGLSPAARSALVELGLWNDLVRRTQHVDSIRLEAPSAIPVTVRGAGEGWVIPRRKLDAMAVDRLRDTGAEIREGVNVLSISPGARDRTEVHVQGPGGPSTIEARWVVIAAGAAWRRRMDGRRGRKIHSMMAWYRGLEHDRHAIELQFTRELYPLYGWVFPEPGGTCNVGIGIESHRLRGRPLGDVFRTFVGTRLAGRTDGAEMIGRPAGFPIMATPWPGKAGRPGVLLAGEAARLVNPVTGEGIAPALRSGILAARAVAGSLRKGGPDGRWLAGYLSDLKREVGPGLVVGEALRTLGVRNLDWIIRHRRHLRGGRRILHFVAHV